MRSPRTTRSLCTATREVHTLQLEKAHICHNKDPLRPKEKIKTQVDEIYGLSGGDKWKKKNMIEKGNRRSHSEEQMADKGNGASRYLDDTQQQARAKALRWELSAGENQQGSPRNWNKVPM